MVDEAFRPFAGALEPLRAAGRLDVAASQFPRCVYSSPLSLGYLERVARQLPGLRELAEWVPKIRTLHAAGRPVHVLLNNCPTGASVLNEFDMPNPYLTPPGPAVRQP
jgi:uncharacterized protein YecE (DUF72 family)